MQSINGDLFALSLEEIMYRLTALTRSQHETVLELIRGKSIDEMAREAGISSASLSGRITSACDRAGAVNRAQLIAMVAIYQYSCTGTNALLLRSNVLEPEK